MLARLAGLTAFSALGALALALAPTDDVGKGAAAAGGHRGGAGAARVATDADRGGRARRAALGGRAAIGAVLQPTELLDVASTGRSAAILKTSVLKYAEELPTLARIADGLGEHRVVVEAIEALDRGRWGRSSTTLAPRCANSAFSGCAAPMAG